MTRASFPVALAEGAPPHSSPSTLPAPRPHPVPHRALKAAAAETAAAAGAVAPSPDPLRVKDRRRMAREAVQHLQRLHAQRARVMARWQEVGAALFSIAPATMQGASVQDDTLLDLSMQLLEAWVRWTHTSGAWESKAAQGFTVDDLWGLAVRNWLRFGGVPPTAGHSGPRDPFAAGSSTGNVDSGGDGGARVGANGAVEASTGKAEAAPDPEHLAQAWELAQDGAMLLRLWRQDDEALQLDGGVDAFSVPLFGSAPAALMRVQCLSVTPDTALLRWEPEDHGHVFVVVEVLMHATPLGARSYEIAYQGVDRQV
jgi:hypothetical protein